MSNPTVYMVADRANPAVVHLLPEGTSATVCGRDFTNDTDLVAATEEEAAVRAVHDMCRVIHTL